MVQIVLIRPGSTDYDEQGRIQGTLNIPLSDHGSDEVKEIVRQLEGQGITAVYSSSCYAAKQTAEAVAAALGVKARTLDKLQNLDHGLWQGMLLEDVKRKQPRVYRQWQEQPEIICPPEGEMLIQAQSRVQAAINKLLKKHKDGKFAIVMPEPLASIAHCLLAGTDVSDLWKAGAAGGTWEVLAVEPANLAQAVH